MTTMRIARPVTANKNPATTIQSAVEFMAGRTSGNDAAAVYS